MELKSLIPWRNKSVSSSERLETAFDRFHKEMTSLFDEFFGRDPFSRQTIDQVGSNVIVPTIDLYDGEKEIKVTAELPGLDQKDLEVTLRDNLLTISGEKKHEEEVKDKDRYYRESSYGTFHRSIPLPAEVEADKIEATFAKGVLSIVLPKIRPSQPVKKISVKVE